MKRFLHLELEIPEDDSSMTSLKTYCPGVRRSGFSKAHGFGMAVTSPGGLTIATNEASTETSPVRDGEMEQPIISEAVLQECFLRSKPVIKPSEAFHGVSYASETCKGAF